MAGSEERNEYTDNVTILMAGPRTRTDRDTLQVDQGMVLQTT